MEQILFFQNLQLHELQLQMIIHILFDRMSAEQIHLEELNFLHYEAILKKRPIQNMLLKDIATQKTILMISQQFQRLMIINLQLT